MGRLRVAPPKARKLRELGAPAKRNSRHWNPSSTRRQPSQQRELECPINWTKSTLDRRTFFGASIAAGVTCSAHRRWLRRPKAADRADRSTNLADHAPQQDELLSKSVAELGAMMKWKSVSSHDLTQRYLARIAQMDKTGVALNAVIELNPTQGLIADQRDAERKAATCVARCTGFQCLIKDNNGKSADKCARRPCLLALGTSTRQRKDAFSHGAVCGRRRGAAWQNESQRVGEPMPQTHSVSGWSGRRPTAESGTLNRNDERIEQRAATGVAIAATFMTVEVSAPRPTARDHPCLRVSADSWASSRRFTCGRSRIVPISASRRTMAGLMARSVADAAALLGPAHVVERATSTNASRKEARVMRR